MKWARRMSRIHCPGSSRPFSILDIVISQPPVRMQYELPASPRLACWLRLRSPLTLWASIWGSWAAPHRCRILGVFCCLLPRPSSSCGSSPCRGGKWGPWWTLSRIRCTCFSESPGTGRKRPQAVGSSGPSRKSCNCRTYVSSPRDLWLSYSPLWTPYMMVLLPCGQGQAVGQRRFLRREHIARTGGWGRGSCSGLRWGRTKWKLRLPPGVGVSPWWLRIPACRIPWGVRG